MWTKDPCLDSAACVLTHMREGTLAASDLMDWTMQRVKQLNPDLNAIVTLDAEHAAQQAEHPLPGPLSGLPITIKDVWQTKGLRSTASHPTWKDCVPDTDASIVSCLKAAGAIVIGKTNLPEMAADSQTDSPLFGRTNNPWDLARTPGGSTGGGAAAVSAGLSFLDAGNDLLGSIRIPAHYCGLCGFVPTSGTMPVSGSMLPAVESHLLRQFLRPGFLARSVDLLEIAWRATAGPNDDNRDLFPVDVQERAMPNLKDISMAWSWTLDHLPLDDSVRHALEAWRERVAASGVILSDIVAGAVPFRDASDAFLNLFLPASALRLPAPIRALMRFSGNRGWHVDLRKVWKAEQKRDEVLCQLDRVFEKVCGVLACPVAAVPAFTHLAPDGRMGVQPIYRKGIAVNGKMENYATVNVGYTIPFTVTGNPVLVLPTGLTEAGLPVGIQLVGRRFRDAELFAVGRALMKALPFDLHPAMAEMSAEKLDESSNFAL